MSVKKLNETWYLRMIIFGKQIFISTSASTKLEARNVEMSVLTSFRSTDFRSLDAYSRAVVLRICKNQGWAIPPGAIIDDFFEEALSLWKAIDLFLNYPEINLKPET